ncbi:hypothetical protein DESPIGER_1102 [Desulfovibrio piger]|uniref:Uncharacterized protein n=1 Tax=Desulfovibrio piger TaxID=901 RepID=A0A1K1LE07_9BACT|nr:hypothetical protein DESPIGER_1102 [Desulfovibrio piger]
MPAAVSAAFRPPAAPSPGDGLPAALAAPSAAKCGAPLPTFLFVINS